MAKFKKALQVLGVTLLIVVGVSMMPGCSANSGGSTSGGKEEYKVLEVSGPSNDEYAAQLTKMLNDYAKEGWKVRTGWGNGGSFIILAR
jgi:hypothetical protein